MVLIVLAGLCLLSVPLTGGNLGRLASVRLGGLWMPMAALGTQVAITVVVPGGHPGLHRALHIGTYVMIAAFLWFNRRLAGATLLGAGMTMNALAIIANGGVMPAAETAERLAGMHLRAGFDNSAHLAHPHLLWLGDVIPWPGPLNNVLSVGDLVVYAGMLVLLHRVCGRRAPRPIRLSVIPDGAAAQPARGGSSSLVGVTGGGGVVGVAGVVGLVGVVGVASPVGGTSASSFS
jgi:hypothetical protein